MLIKEKIRQEGYTLILIIVVCVTQSNSNQAFKLTAIQKEKVEEERNLEGE